MTMNPILIVKIGAVGDVLRTTSLLQGLKEHFPGNPIWWVTSQGGMELLKNNPFIGKIILWDDGGFTDLAASAYFRIIILEEDEEVCRFASGLTGEKVGYIWKDGKVVPTSSAAEWHAMSALGKKPRNDELKKANRKTWQRIMQEIVGIRPKQFDTLLYLTAQEKAFGDGFAKKNGIEKDDLVIGVNTGAGGRWPLKILSEEKTIELIEKIKNELHPKEINNSKNKKTKKQIKIILLGGPEEAGRNKRIAFGVSGVIDAGCDNDLRQFASIVNICDVVVTSDSLAMHIAIALRKMVVAFFAPTSSAEIELYGMGEKVVPRGGCVCCYKKDGLAKPSCNDMLEVDDFIEALKKVIR